MLVDHLTLLLTVVSKNFLPPGPLTTSLRCVSSHVRTGIGDDKLSSGMSNAWCLGLGVVIARCLPSFARATCQQRQSDNKLVACPFAGVKSPWCGASLVPGVALSASMLAAFFTSEWRPGEYEQLLFFSSSGVSRCQSAGAGWTCETRA